jgi:hypothetical protein
MPTAGIGLALPNRSATSGTAAAVLPPEAILLVSARAALLGASRVPREN